MRHNAALDEGKVPRDAELKFRDRAKDLVEMGLLVCLWREWIDILSMESAIVESNIGWIGV